jgi:hypothetical protein
MTTRDCLALNLTCFSRPKEPVADENRALLQELVKDKNANEQRFERLLTALENHTGVGHETNMSDKEPKDLSAIDLSLTEPATGLIERRLDIMKHATHLGALAVLPTPRPLEPSKSTEQDNIDHMGTIRAEAMAPRGLPDPIANRQTPSSADFDRTPAGIRIRQKEIEHHAILVSNLLQEISNVQYRIDHGIRHRMQTGILKIHWDE